MKCASLSQLDNVKRCEKRQSTKKAKMLKQHISWNLIDGAYFKLRLFVSRSTTIFLMSLLRERVQEGTNLSNHDRDGYETSLKNLLAYSISFNSSNVGKLFWGWI